jgi:hypothetical protein
MYWYWVSYTAFVLAKDRGCVRALNSSELKVSGALIEARALNQGIRYFN